MNPAEQRQLDDAVTPRERDRVRVRVTRKSLEEMLGQLVVIARERSYLSSLESEVALFDVRTDLEIAGRHLGSAAGALERIEQGLAR